MIELYVRDIRESLKNKCYFSALSLALTLPDICGMAEYPEETSVTKRYIDWYDNFPGVKIKRDHDKAGLNCPWLSGEIVYNLRNTYLHQGAPTIVGSKVKENANQLDCFILVLGDGTVIWDSALSVDMGNGMVSFKAMMVDVTYLCENLCDCAADYYQQNREKFALHFHMMEQEKLKNVSKSSGKPDLGDLAANILNHRLIAGRNPLKAGKKKLDSGAGRKKGTEEKNGKKIRMESNTGKRGKTAKKDVKTAVADAGETAANHSKQPKLSRQKREAQVRCYYGQHFKKDEHREEIIQAVLQAKTKQQVNNNLMKIFHSAEAGEVYKKLSPLLKEMPGR